MKFLMATSLYMFPMNISPKFSQFFYQKYIRVSVPKASFNFFV